MCFCGLIIFWVFTKERSRVHSPRDATEWYPYPLWLVP